MGIGWHFRLHNRVEKVRNPIQGEFFSDEAVGNPAQALVREAIQNSMDARPRESRAPVRVRIFVSGGVAALSAARAREWFDDVWPHVCATGSGVRVSSSRPTSCPFVVIEDFGTSGLLGDPRQGNVADGRNRFFNFWRAEGVTEKRGTQGGRWGVGKTVFPRTSGVNTFFGVTIREGDPRPLLMGHCTLRHHLLRESEFTPDGFFGEAEGDGFVVPVTDDLRVRRFSADFNLARLRESGLSVVVAYADEEVTFESVTSAVVRDYFLPILRGELSVDVECPDAKQTLNARTLQSVVESRKAKLADLVPVFELASWVVSTTHHYRFAQRHGAQAPPCWSSASLAEEDQADLRKRYLEGARVAVRVPMTVRPVDGPARETHFDVYLQRDLGGKGSKPTFVRNGIIIPDVRERRVYGHRLHAFIVCDDEPIANLLGDAETPAHTHWSKDAKNFRGKYQDGAAYLTFVSQSPRSMAELLSAAPTGKDVFSLANLFPRPKDAAEGGTPRTEDGAGSPGLPRPPASGLGGSFRLDEIKEGVAISAGPGLDELPQRVRAEFAYDVRRGNALAKYHPADFRLESLRVALERCRILRQDRNLLEVEPQDKDFRVTVAGFDGNRDLYVRVRGVRDDD